MYLLNEVAEALGKLKCYHGEDAACLVCIFLEYVYTAPERMQTLVRVSLSIHLDSQGLLSIDSMLHDVFSSREWVFHSGDKVRKLKPHGLHYSLTNLLHCVAKALVDDLAQGCL